VCCGIKERESGRWDNQRGRRLGRYQLLTGAEEVVWFELALSSETSRIYLLSLNG
jgi:hypothetical protein